MSYQGLKIVDTGPIDPRWKLVQNCINGCDPPMLVNTVPHSALPPQLRQGIPIQILNQNRQGNGMARCIRCGTYWEVTPQGEIINRSQWEVKGNTPLEKKES